MNAFGITSGANTAATTGAASGAAAGKSAAGEFAGALVQAIGGTSAGGNQASEIGKPAGMAGLLNLIGSNPFTETSSAEVLDLLQSLADQLGSIPPGTSLPEGLQEELAALFLLIQNVWNAHAAVQNPSAVGEKSFHHAFGGEGNNASSAPTGPRLIAALQQSLNRLADQLRSGAVPAEQTASLLSPLKQNLEAMQQFAAAKSPVGTMAAAEKSVIIPENGPIHMKKAETANADPVFRMEIRSEVRAGIHLLRNPATPILTDASAVMSTAAAAEAHAAGGTAGHPEASGQSGTVPAWTLLKSDLSVVTGTGSAASNAPVPSPVPVQQFAEQMGKFLVRQFVLTQGQGTMEAKLSLAPEHLGQVDIRIQIQNGQLTAQFVAENGAARDMLETQMSQLRTALQGQGLQVEKVEVVLQSSHNSAPSFHQHHGQHGTGHHGSGSQNRGARGGYEDSAAFEAELDRTAFLREIGYGASLNVTA